MRLPLHGHQVQPFNAQAHAAWEETFQMKILKNFLGLTALALIFTAAASADTLELKDGRVLQGKFLGGTRVIVRFEVDGDVQTFRVNEISALSFDRHSRRDDRRDDAAPPPPPNGPSDAPP